MKNQYFNKYTENYWIIGLLCCILVFLMPFLGSVMGLGWVLPNTVVGWIVYVATKLAVCAINFMIFHSFVKQSKLNVRLNPNFLEAQKILQIIQPEEKPRSPKEFFRKQYTHKGSTLIITTLLSTICISQAIFTFDYISLISYALSVVLCIVFGVKTMREDEDFWTYEYLQYAKLKEKELKEETTNDTTTSEL